MTPKLPASFPGGSNLDTFTSFLALPTGLSPYVALRSRRVRLAKRGLKEGPQHHISNAFQRPIQFAVCCVQSLLLAASQLISFPAGTKAFQFPALSTLSGSRGSPIRRSPVQRLHTSRQSISQLAASFIVVENQVFHLIAYVSVNGIISRLYLHVYSHLNASTTSISRFLCMASLNVSEWDERRFYGF